MPRHLIKLAVGCDSVADLERWIADTQAMLRRLGRPPEQLHTTRMVPRRLDMVAGGEGGSVYWVIKGQLQCRQRLIAVRPFTDQDGIGRCHLVLEPVVHPVRTRPMRPFQGWRYLEDKDAPPDLGAAGAAVAEMPDHLRKELSGLGLL